MLASTHGAEVVWLKNFPAAFAVTTNGSLKFFSELSKQFQIRRNLFGYFPDATLATDLASTRIEQTAQIFVLKKAMDLQGQGAIQLVTAATQGYNNPPHPGNGVDVFA